jgi:integrase
LAEITGLDVSEFGRHLREVGLALSSVTAVLAVVRGLLADAVAGGVVPAAPAVRLWHRRTGAGTPVCPGVAVGVEAVLAVCARLSVQEALMVVVALFTGMRWGEVCGVRRQHLHAPGEPGGRHRAWYRVDARDGAVHEDVHARRFFGPPKGGAGRVIDLPPFLAGLLAEHCSVTGGVDLLFANRRGEPIRNSDFLRRWRPACDGAAQRLARDGRVLAAATAPLCLGLRFHDLRHSLKTLLTELGVPEVLQDERLGHHPPGMRTVYAHPTAAMRAAMLEGLERIWQRTGAQPHIGPRPDP